MDLDLSYGIDSSKIYVKRGDFNFEIINFAFLDGDVSRSLSYGVYTLQHIRFVRVCSDVDCFNNRNFIFDLKVIKTMSSIPLNFKKPFVGKPSFSDQFKKIIKCYKRVGYNMDIVGQSACLVVNHCFSFIA